MNKVRFIFCIALPILIFGLLSCSGTPQPKAEDSATGGGGGVSVPSVELKGNLKLKNELKLKAQYRDITISNPSNEIFTVLATANETGESFYGQTGTNGGFTVSIPESKTNNTFTLTILSPVGHAVGPILLGTNSTGGFTGLSIGSNSDIGDIDVPSVPGSNGIFALNPSTVGVVSNTKVNLSATGAPTGLESLGKGTNSLGSLNASTNQAQDKDQDGLVDALDADDDGNGVIDDFESNTELVKKSGLPAGYQVFIVQVLALQPHQLTNYYNGSAADVSNALARDMRLELWVYVPAQSGVNDSGVSSVKILENPGPTYIKGLSAMSYDLPYQPQEFQNNGRPLFKGGGTYNTMLNAGDSFTFQVNYADGTKKTFTRMLNYVFKSALRLLQTGSSNNMTNFALFNKYNQYNGGPSTPVLFDGTNDLYLTFNPPKDEEGKWLTNINRWEFQMGFFNTNNQQIGTIDLANTWNLSERNEIGGGFATQNLYYSLDNSLLPAPVGGSNYTIRLSKNIFKDSVQLQGGGSSPIGSYMVGMRAYMNDSYIEINIITAKREYSVPTITLTNVTPTAGHLKLDGQVFDNRATESVYLSTNASPFFPVMLNTADEPDRWGFDSNVPAGTYNILYYAEDTSGNSSITNGMSNIVVP